MKNKIIMMFYIVLIICLGMIVKTYAADSANVFVGGFASDVVGNSDPQYAAGKACDGSQSTKAVDNGTMTIYTWQYDLGNGVTKKITTINVMAANIALSDYSLKDYIIMGSNNGTSWDSIYTGVGSNTGVFQSISFTNNNSYRYYKFVMTSTYYQADQRWHGIVEIEGYESVGVPPPDPGGTVSPQDLIDLTSNLSKIISFFAGCLAIMGFIMGVNGGKMS
jgi:hypothetical protein